MFAQIHRDTYGLVFFSCPHHDANGVKLSSIASEIARFVSKGRSHELPTVLQNNALFSQEMSETFRTKLKQYQIINFIEQEPLRLGSETVSKHALHINNNRC